MRLISLAASLGILAACGGSDSSSNGAGGSGGADAGSDAGTSGGGGASGAITYEFETIGTRSATIGETIYQAELVAAHRSDGGTSYLMVIPAVKSPASVVVDMAPYTGIDWTGEEVDTRHATKNPGPFGLYPDTDAPLDPPSTEKCVYGFMSAETQIQSEAYHLLNGHAVVVAFGRFYAGGSLADDADDDAAPFHYIAARAADFEAGRIGVHGNSWGGFMALHGVAGRPAGQAIRAVTALNPPTDFVDLYNYWMDTLPAVYPYKDELGMFEGYRRRIEATTGGPPAEHEAAFAPWQDDDLCARLDGDVMIPQDDWDTLVPVTQTEAFIPGPALFRRGHAHPPAGEQSQPQHLRRALRPFHQERVSQQARASRRGPPTRRGPQVPRPLQRRAKPSRAGRPAHPAARQRQPPGTDHMQGGPRWPAVLLPPQGSLKRPDRVSVHYAGRFLTGCCSASRIPLDDEHSK